MATRSKTTVKPGSVGAPIPVKQLRFLQHLTEGDGPGKPPIDQGEAARRAGYPRRSATEQSCYILSRPNVKAWLEEHRRKLAERHDITMDRIVDELAKVGFSNIGRYLRPDERGMPAFRRLDEITEADLAAISEITVESKDMYEGRGDDREKVGVTDKVKFKLASKVDSLMQLARLLGYVGGPGGGDSGDEGSGGEKKVIIEVRQTAMPLPRKRSEFKDD